MRHFLKTIPHILRTFYSGKLLMLQVLACMLTYVIVRSDFDWKYFVFMQTFPYASIFHLAVSGGFILPILMPFIIIGIEAARKQKMKEEYGWMILQSAFLGWAISSFYKAFTGRVQPDRHNLLVDGSHGFHFGFLQHGIFWGWPSSHTAVAFSMAFAVITTTKRMWLKIMVFLLALYVGIGVSFSIHWFSEFIAGALIGAAIGMSIGKTWKKLL